MVQFAIGPSGERLEASRGLSAICPSCGQAVIPKCGRIRVHHWAHEADRDCDPWSEGETTWHRAWKSQFDSRWVEVPVGPHRADVKLESGLVIECQHSAMTPAEVAEREKFYGKMIWLVDAEPFAERFFIVRRMGERYLAFRWKHMKRAWLTAKKPVILDFGARTVRDLLGVTDRAHGQFFSPKGDNYLFQRATTLRLGEVRGSIDRSLVELPDSILNCRLLRLNTKYEGGRGSIEPLSDDDFFTKIGVR